MNTITNHSTRTLSIAFAAVMLLALSFAVAPKAHAADDGFIYPDSIDYSVPVDNTIYPDYIDYPSYDNSSPSYAPLDYGSYATPFYMSSGYGYGGSFGASYAPSNVNQNTSVFAPTNTCTATNSCNTTTQINAPTNIVTNTSGGGGYNYPVYQPVYVPSYPYNYPVPPISTNTGCGYTVVCPPAPYVALSAVPYTGLDLGPWGTAAYWGFLILWCLGAAYLIVVKRVQNKLVSGLNAFLFGTGVKHTHTVAHAPVVKASAPIRSAFGNIDPFIASQISRAAI